jgi:outer membrane protein insertion porin family
MRFRQHFVVFLAALAALTPLRAQAPGPIVRDIAVEYVGPPSISKERVLDNLATRLGQPYSERAAEADIRSLYATGGVANVRIFAEPFADGVKVTVLLQGLPVVDEIVIEGAYQIPLRRVRREIGSKVGDTLSEERLEDDRQKILTLYQNKNFSDVTVQYRTEEIPGTNRVRVVFQITEGPRLIVRRITFVGNDSVLRRDLIKVMKARTGTSFLSSPGPANCFPRRLKRIGPPSHALSEPRLRGRRGYRRSHTAPGKTGSRVDHNRSGGHPVSRQLRQDGGSEYCSDR